jgi:protocatechuate 3,4-dioxygenase beta subunit
LITPLKIIYVSLLLSLICIFTNCIGQHNQNIAPLDNGPSNKLVGGGCDGCELMYVGIPEIIKSVDTSAGWSENGQKLLITGRVYKLGGRIPAPDVIIYYWQTDNNGYYSPTERIDPKAKRHGHIRGWVKSNENGQYAICTNKPAPYPNESMPAHIHIAIKEPNIKDEYYIDEFVFDDDPLLTGPKRKSLENRGGSGILRILLDKELQIAEHNIILGLNIPNYPKQSQTKLNSGLEIGEDNPSFTPFHAYGPDKGTETCPVCKYGRFHGIVYFVGNSPNWSDIKNWLSFLERESVARSKYLKVYFVYGDDKDYTRESRRNLLENLGDQLNIKNIALTFVPSFYDERSEVILNKINPNVDNTFIIYKNRSIIEKFVNLKPTSSNYQLISQTLDKTKNDYFYLPETKHE